MNRQEVEKVARYLSGEMKSWAKAASLAAWSKAGSLASKVRNELPWLLRTWNFQFRVHGHNVKMKWAYIGVASVVLVICFVGFVEVWHASLALLVEWGIHHMIDAVDE